jgi:hypothetical protein
VGAGAYLFKGDVMSEIVDKPDVKTFDLGEHLAGRGYPEQEVSIFLDETIGFAIAEADRKLQTLSSLGKTEEYNALEEKQQVLFDSLAERRLVVTVRGVPRKVKRDIYAKVQSEFPAKKDAFGREEFPVEASELTDQLLWTAHIVKVTSPDGTSVTPSPDEVQQLRDLAPMADLKSIQAGIEKVDNAGEGFEIASRSVDFLSKP